MEGQMGASAKTNIVDEYDNIIFDLWYGQGIGDTAVIHDKVMSRFDTENDNDKNELAGSWLKRHIGDVLSAPRHHGDTRATKAPKAGKPATPGVPARNARVKAGPSRRNA